MFLKQVIKCYEWKLSEKRIKSAKFVTYKNLTLRKYTEDNKYDGHVLSFIFVFHICVQ